MHIKLHVKYMHQVFFYLIRHILLQNTFIATRLCFIYLHRLGADLYTCLVCTQVAKWHLGYSGI